MGTDPQETRRATPSDTDASPLPSAATDLPQQIANFRVIGLIGAGGMGAVYEAEQMKPRRTVALKVIRPGLVSSEARRRFETEVQVLGRLQHRGIAQIFEAGVTDLGGGPQQYFAMELVRGEPLLDYAARHKLRAKERLRLIADICDAVHHAHQRGIIHRDLKPANILVESDSGQPKVLDFGVARATDSDLQATTYTQLGQLVGTLPYMSPEQVAGDPAGIDTRSDVYALGVILYELLTGRLPYDLERRSAIDVMYTIRDVEPTRITTFDRQYRGDIETVVAKALEKQKDRRYASAAELAADIRRHLDDQPIVARPPSVSYQLRKFTRRNKALVGGVVAAFLILIAGVVASTMQAFRATRAERLASSRLLEATQARGEAQQRATEATSARALADQKRAEAETNFALAEEARGRAEQQREANRQLLYVSDMNLTRRMWEEGNHPRVLELLGRHLPAQGASDLRGFEWFYFWRASHLYERSMEARSFTESMDLAGDGTTVASSGADGSVRVWDARTGLVHFSRASGTRARSVSLSADARILAIGSSVAEVIDTRSGKTLGEFSLGVPGGIVQTVRLSGDGRSVLAGSGNRTKVWDIASSKELLNNTGITLPIAGAATMTLLLASPTDVRIWSPAGEVPLTLGDRIREASGSPDGTRLVTFGGAGLIEVWDLNGKLHGSVRSDRPFVVPIAPAVSAGGQRVGALTSAGFTVWDTATSRILATVTVPPGLRESRLFPGGSMLALSATDGVTLFDLPRGRVKAVLRGHASPARLIVSPDERRLLTQSSDSVKVWDLARVSPVDTADRRDARDQIISFAVSPDGRWLASVNRSSVSGPNPASSVLLWDAASLTTAKSRPYTGEAIVVAMPAPNLVVFGDAAGSLSIWNPAGDAAPVTFKAHDQLLRSLTSSPDGKRVATAADDAVRVWEMPSGRPVVELPQRRTMAVAFAPDLRHLATGGFDANVRIWNLARRVEARAFRGPAAIVTSLAYSPDGRSLAAGYESGEVTVWSTVTSREAARVRAHASRVTSLSFSPDGRRLLSGGFDGIVRVWDASTWNEVAQFRESQLTFVNIARWSPDGQAIVAAGGSLVVWRAADRNLPRPSKK